MVGALNRTLNMNGVTWQFGEMALGEWTLADESGTADGIEVYKRYRLSGTGEVYANAGAEPWLVRSGSVVIVASRMAPEWTRLPISASFVPFVDYLINRIAAKENWIVTASPGEVVELPSSAGSMVGERPSDITTVTSDRITVAPQQMGVYFLRGAGGDTVGALEVNADVRESRLQVSDEGQLRAAFGENVQVLESTLLLRRLFGGEGRINLAGLFLVLAFVAAASEFWVASSGGKTRTA
jgi:hypothetical protein